MSDGISNVQKTRVKLICIVRTNYSLKLFINHMDEFQTILLGTILLLVIQRIQGWKAELAIRWLVGYIHRFVSLRVCIIISKLPKLLCSCPVVINWFANYNPTGGGNLA